MQRNDFGEMFVVQASRLPEKTQAGRLSEEKQAGRLHHKGIDCTGYSCTGPEVHYAIFHER